MKTFKQNNKADDGRGFESQAAVDGGDWGVIFDPFLCLRCSQYLWLEGVFV
ncbi:hypothetical protein GCM10007877_09110 [Marinibactrum halimedae]|uniref:Uncharacterized protein n=1 Tax=Marinibactrum halimedae TaxID=1444977 RepID=A0AA37T9M0_9GAMM|nr:hypothetical protein GCM10007877_09110 [Marinibactrum halimedae]